MRGGSIAPVMSLNFAVCAGSFSESVTHPLILPKTCNSVRSRLWGVDPMNSLIGARRANHFFFNVWVIYEV